MAHLARDAVQVLVVAAGDDECGAGVVGPPLRREPLQQSAAEAAEDEQFFRWYGPWAPLDPDGLVDFMAGFAQPWWIVGGWSIEAFTGHRREHEDIDLSILACDLPAFREHVGDGWHLWSNHGGTLRPEITLLHKAVLHRPKDDRDLAVTWPLLGAGQQDWLREAVGRLDPGHPWLSGTMES